MVKLLGAGCILGAAVWAWRRAARERKRKLDMLADLIRLLERMEEEMDLRRTSLPRLLEELGRGRGPEVRRFCTAVASSLEQGAPLGESWWSAGEALPLDGEARSAVTALGGSLQGNEGNVCKAILLTRKILGKHLEEAQAGRAEREKRSGALWLSGAALLVILLI